MAAMTPERRRALELRRELAARERQQEADIGDMTRYLEAASTSYRLKEPDAEMDWAPKWIPDRYDSVPWPIIRGAEHRQFLDVAARNAFVGALIMRWSVPSTPILIVYRERRYAIEILRGDLLQHLDELTPLGAAEIWLTAPSAQWLIEIRGLELSLASGKEAISRRA